MKKIRYTLFIVLMLVVSFAKGQVVGDSCINPIIVKACNDSAYTVANADSFLYTGNKWWDTYIEGDVIFYQINLPTSSYNPVSISVFLKGYFLNYYFGTPGTIYFYWFDSSSCSSSFIAKDSSILTGSSTSPDSILVTYPVSTVQSKYYLIIALSSGEQYSYSLQFNYTNNQPPPPTGCTPNLPPYKGEMQLDKSVCYTPSNPYHLPLSELNDSSSIPNVLLPHSLNQNLNYLPIDDHNGNGFILELRSDVANSFPSYQTFIAFDSLYYNYSYNPQYTVGITVFMKNSTGATGLEGFRIQIPGDTIVPGVNYPNDGDTGTYNASGNWTVSAYGNTCTWLFNSSNGRGDNIDNNGYSCKVYTFSLTLSGLGGTINAWYLPDFYGNDSLDCHRTDCSFADNQSSVWIPLIGTDGSGIKGTDCENTSLCYFDAGFYPCLPPLAPDICPHGDTSVVITFDDHGCSSTYLSIAVTSTIAYDFQDIPPENATNELTVDTEIICPGGTYDLKLTYFTPYLYNQSVPSIIVYLDSITGLYYPVDSNGNIIFTKDFVSIVTQNNSSMLPVYPQTAFSIPLTVPGFYTIGYFSYSLPAIESCLGGLVLMVDSPNIKTNPTNDTLCKGQEIQITASGANNYTWFPNIGISATTGSKVSVMPVINTTYSVTGTNECADTATTIITIISLSSPYINQNSDTLECTQTYYTYQWYYNDSAIIGATNQFYIATANGKYTLQVSNKSDCIQIDSIEYIDTKIGNVVNENNFNISPNPSDGVFNISFSNNFASGTIEIYNILGEIIDTRLKTQDSKLITIDLSNQPAGVYFVKVQTENGMVMKKVVKN